MSAKKTPRERLKDACYYWAGSGYSRLCAAARAVLDELEPEPAPRAMTKAERALCEWAKLGRKYININDRCPKLMQLANAVWDEAHPPAAPKRTLEDVEREIRGHDISTSLGLDCVQELMNERKTMLDQEKES